jgi:hypothetical protein
MTGQSSAKKTTGFSLEFIPSEANVREWQKQKGDWPVAPTVPYEFRPDRNG